jgi:hypothetical protein
MRLRQIKPWVIAFPAKTKGKRMNFSSACDQVTELVSASQDGSLSFRRRLRLWLHLRTCHACNLFQKQVRMLSETVRKHRIREAEAGFPEGPGLSDEARQRIKDKLKSQHRTGR